MPAYPVVRRKRTALAKVLAQSFDVLLLDEPTNHLDEEMILWLEDYLKAFRGTILMVTHDRYFLDKVTTRILEIEGGSCTVTIPIIQASWNVRRKERRGNWLQSGREKVSFAWSLSGPAEDAGPARPSRRRDLTDWRL